MCFSRLIALVIVLHLLTGKRSHDLLEQKLFVFDLSAAQQAENKATGYSICSEPS